MMTNLSNGANEVNNLGLKILELNGIPKEDLDDVTALRRSKLRKMPNKSHWEQTKTWRFFFFVFWRE